MISLINDKIRFLYSKIAAWLYIIFLVHKAGFLLFLNYFFFFTDFYLHIYINYGCDSNFYNNYVIDWYNIYNIYNIYIINNIILYLLGNHNLLGIIKFLLKATCIKKVRQFKELYQDMSIFFIRCIMAAKIFL